MPVDSGLVHTAHDVSDGGLAVALAEMCLAGAGIGANVTVEVPGREDVALFGESGCRAIVAVDEAHAEELEKSAARARVRWHKLGTTGGDRLVISREGSETALVDLDIESMAAPWEAGLPRIAAGPSH